MTDEIMTDQDYAELIARSDKDTLWWALYRLLNALHAARAIDPACSGKPDWRGGIYSVAHFTADHWAPQIPGMPTAFAVREEIAADDLYHNLTFAAESVGLRVTGDEFIPTA